MNFQIIQRLFVLSVLSTSLFCGCNGENAGPQNNSKKEKQIEKKKEAEANGPVSVEVYVLKGQKYTEKIELPGSSVQGMETSKLFSRVGGYVKEIKKLDGKEIDIGSLVKKDMPLIEIDIPELRDELVEKNAKVEQAKSAVGQADAAIAQAEALIVQRTAEVKQAASHKSEKKALLNLQKTKLNRLEGLVKEGSIGEEILDEAKYAVKAAQSSLDSVTADEKAAQANVSASQAGKEKAIADKASAVANLKVATAVAKRAKTMVGFATVNAPFDGIITKRFVDHGAFVRPANSNSGAMPLFEVSRIDKVRVLASVPNTHASQVKNGQKIMFSGIGGLPGVGVLGEISHSSNTLDKLTRMMPIDIVFSNPVKEISSDDTFYLKPGMYGTVSVTLKEWKSLPVVPVSTIQYDELEQAYVLVVNGTTCQKHEVDIVFDNAKTVGVATDIEIGQKIVLNPAGKLIDGQKIVVKTK